MGPRFHFHLEQPIGSDMLFQEPLQMIIDNTFRVRCDLCTAGSLKHPTIDAYLQKGLQILTTSEIMSRGLQPFVCQKRHQHVPVAGNFQENGWEVGESVGIL